MTNILIAVYFFIAIATTFAVHNHEDNSLSEVIACFMVGITWPLFWTIRTMQRLLR